MDPYPVADELLASILRVVTPRGPSGSGTNRGRCGFSGFVMRTFVHRQVLDIHPREAKRRACRQGEIR